MILIDSDIFVIDLRYQRDPNYPINQTFLNDRSFPRSTTIFNLLEVCGIMSFNLSQANLFTLYAQLAGRYDLTLLYPPTEQKSGQDFLTDLISSTFLNITNKMSFQDALILYVTESHPDVEKIISWNARHYRGKTHLNAQTPLDYLRETGYSLNL